jgi:ABC-type antimicrobial peptide transport system permease subunit
VIAVVVVTIASMAASREQPGAERRIVSSSLRAGRALVISQIAISLLLVVGSTTLAVSFSKLRQVHPGFRTSGLLTSRISLPAGQYNDEAKRARFWRTLIRDLGEKGIPAAITTELPLSGDDNPTNFTTRLNDGQTVTTKLRSVSANYLEVMHIPLIEGRQLSDRDVAGAPRAVVINEKLALFLSRLGPPVGQMISFDAAATPTVVQVVGVVGNIRHERLNSEPKPELYVPFEQTPLQTYSLVLDGPSTSADASRILLATINNIDRAQPFTDIVPISGYIERNLAGSRFETGALSLFALVALLVASTGLYGLLTHLVTATRREWALRLVLGASPIQLRNIVLKQSLADALFGFGVGAALFFLVYRWFQGVFYGVSPWNPWLLAASGAVVSTTCVLSATIPALRALRISPAEALSE